MKSLIRSAEETVHWVVSELATANSWGLPVVTGKRYMADAEGDELTLPVLVVGCDRCVANPELYDTSVGEAVITIGLIRDNRAEEMAEHDTILQEILSHIFDPTPAVIDQINSIGSPHFGTVIAHEFAPAEEMSQPDSEADKDILQFIFHLQHFLP